MDPNWEKSVSLEKVDLLEENVFSFPSIPRVVHGSQESRKSEHIM